MSTVKLGYASMKNISFKGEVDTRIPQEDWDEMTEQEKDGAISDIAADLVDIWVVGE